jgi:hypothetical protein
MMAKRLEKAAIAGFDGNIWANSENFNLTADEVKKIVENYKNASDSRAAASAGRA